MRTCFLLLIVSSGLLFYSCTSDSKAGSKASLPKALPPMNEDKIYNAYYVNNYLFDNEERDTDSVRQASRKLFLQAIDFYKNKKDYRQAIPLFKKSILLYPDAKSYNELGNILFETANYKECLDAYEMAVELKYSPLANTYFNMACATASLDGGGSGFNYLNSALENGFHDSLRFTTDPHLAKIRTDQYYRDLLFKYFITAPGKRENMQYGMFLEGFPILNLPYEITPENTREYSSSNYIGYDFNEFIEEMENVSFGRDVSNEFCYVGILKQTDHYTALLYNSVEMMGGPFLSPVTTMIVTYNPKGEVISKKVFACGCSAEKVKSGSFDGTIITVTEHSVQWEKEFDAGSPDENKIVGYEPGETTKYILNESGEITVSTAS